MWFMINCTNHKTTVAPLMMNKTLCYLNTKFDMVLCVMLSCLIFCHMLTYNTWCTSVTLNGGFQFVNFCTFHILKPTKSDAKLNKYVFIWESLQILPNVVSLNLTHAKTDRHDITEILLKVALNTITLTL